MNESDLKLFIQALSKGAGINNRNNVISSVSISIERKSKQLSSFFTIEIFNGAQHPHLPSNKYKIVLALIPFPIKSPAPCWFLTTTQSENTEHKSFHQNSRDQWNQFFKEMVTDKPLINEA